MPSDGERFFEERLRAVADAFERSDVKTRQEKLRRPNSNVGHWYYSLAAVPIVRRKPVLLGLNWKAKDSERYRPQTVYPGKRDWLEVAQWPHIKADRERVTKHLAPLCDVNYFNVCPFRSRDLTDLAPNDWQLGIECFFEDTMRFVSPPAVLIHGTEGVRQLGRLGLTDSRVVVVQVGAKSAIGKVGWLRVGGDRFPFWAIPRPRDLHSDDHKNHLWDSVFAQEP